MNDSERIYQFEQSFFIMLDLLYAMNRDKVTPCKGQVNYWKELQGRLDNQIKHFESIAEF